MSVTVDDVTDH